MYPRGHRGFGMLVMLFVLLVSGLTVLPSHAQGQNQIVGLVFKCGSPTVFLSGALVTLTDANGVQPATLTTTGGDGTFTFSPTPSNFTISVTKTGYYTNGTALPFRFDGSITVTKSICLFAQPSTSKKLDITVINATSTAISGAAIDVYNLSNPTTQIQLVASATSNSTGKANVTLWTPGIFEVRTTASGYSPNVTKNVDPTATPSITVSMVPGNQIVGHAMDSAGRFVSAGLQGWLYNASEPATSGLKVIRAVVNGSLYTFNAPAGTGTYRMIIDANGYRAFETDITLPVDPPNPQDAVLQVAEKEVYQTTVLYGSKDWNNITVYRNLTLNPDGTLPGLNPTNLRDLRLQVDYTVGNADGTLNAAENASFRACLQQNGPLYSTTDGFLTTNGKAYNSSMTSYTVSVANLLGSGKVWINTTATYNLKQTPYIAYGAQKYYVNVTTRDDSNASVYQDQVYVVQLPKAYEMTGSTIVNPPVTTQGFTRITLDPGIPTSGTTSQVRMVIQKSLNGTANGKVAAPTGMFHVVNASFDNYRAYVANNTNLTFSAEDSKDPIGDITKANFTWHFLANDTDANLTKNIGYGIRAYYTYNKTGDFVVNLTVVQAGGNKTYRDIRVWVDGETPIAKIRTNKTGAGAVNGTTLKINEKTPIRFDASQSTDLAYAGKKGVVLDTGYTWDFNGDRITDSIGSIVNYTFPKPGNFTVNLTVTDSVGWKSVNATITAIVNDTTPPVPAFDIRDPSNDWAIVTTLTENHAYSFNASRTTDNYDKASALNYTWTIPGPVGGLSGTKHPMYGMNITFTWQEFNSTYRVILNVTDTGFSSGKMNTGNLTRDVTVQVDWTARPDLKIEAGSLKITPADPEDGATITVTVNVSNKVNRGLAQDVKAQLISISGGVSTVLSSTPEWRNKTGASKANTTITSGETVQFIFTATLRGQGNRTIQVYVCDSKEPYTACTAENRASQSIFVRQAGWVNYAIYGSVLGVLAVFVGYAYYRRKVRAGEWQPMRLRRGKKAEGEEKKARKEVKEEKKRL